MSPVISSVCSRLVGDVRVEPARLGVRGDRLLVEAAVAAGVDEAGEELGVVAVARRPRRAGARAASRRLADVGLEVGVELVGDGQARVERRARAGRPPRPAPRCPRALVDVLADHPVAATEARPRRRELRVQLEAPLVEVARHRAVRS